MNSNNGYAKNGSVVPKPKEHISTKMGKVIANAVVSVVKDHKDKAKVAPK